MQEGSFRCDANVSVRKPGDKLGTRREIKNLNSFKFMQQAIDYEIRWQIEEIEDGREIEQATVLFDPDTGETRAMRAKEDSADYRYFPDPDLPPLVIAADWIERVKATMPELPRAMAERYVREHGLSEYDAAQLTQSTADAAYFDAVVAAGATPKLASNWITGEIARRLKSQDLDISESPVSAAQLGWMLKPLSEGVFDNSVAKKLFDSLWKGIHTGYSAATLPAMTASSGNSFDTNASALDVIKSLGLEQISDTSALEAIIDGVLATNQKNIDEYRGGKEKALNGLVGQVMKASGGKANPAQVTELLKAKLG
jgi:aspartyl-tRNA(Asn)/glutamyl-tRNA(Gln) amidotransferase subunit B